MSDPTIRRTSRRNVLASALAAAVAAAAAALGRAPTVRAASGDPLIVGDVTNTAEGLTLLTTSEGSGLWVVANAVGGGSALSGEAPDGTGVQALSVTGSALTAQTRDLQAVVASSTNHIAVDATSDSVTHAAIRGQATYRAGVYGSSSSGPIIPPAAPNDVGVMGFAADTASARGVFGRTSIGRGVHGLATTGIGVLAQAGTSGTALQALGQVRFSSAGRTVIAAGTRTSPWIVPGYDVTTATKVLATLESDPGASTTVQRVEKDPTNDRFRVHLTANAVTAVNVAYFGIS